MSHPREEMFEGFNSSGDDTKINKGTMSEGEVVDTQLQISRVQKRIVVFGKDGLPVPASAPMLSEAQLGAMPLTAASLPYETKPREHLTIKEKEEYLKSEKQYEGLSNGEVMVIKMAKEAADGNTRTTEIVLDRVLGKPKQTSEIKTMHFTYEDFLKEKAKKENEKITLAENSEAIDAEVEEDII